MGIKIVFLLFFILFSLEAKERIVSLSPSLCEILFALDMGDEVVGVSSYSLYPKAATKLPIVGSYTNPNLEKVIALSPTLVIGQEFNTKSLQDIKKFGIASLGVSLKSIADIRDAIALLGKRFFKQAEAKKLIAAIDDAIKNAKKSQTPHSVLIVYGLHEDLRSGIYIAGHHIFFDEIIKLSGNTNAYTKESTTQPVLNYENVIALNPEQIIILHSLKSQPNINIKRALKAWYNIPTRASKNKKISIVDADYIHIPSHRIAQTITKLAQEMRE